jgi:exopolyphosphatase/guanosine-5'-triphosphate,3'-diphosphate pyrophosphatase
MTIVPRWEWRIFGAGFGEAEKRLAALAPSREEESDDRYLLSLASDASVKVRGGLLDVKERLAVNEDGLEQWTPIVKATFPVVAAEVDRTLEALAVRIPLERSSYSVDELFDELAGPELRPIDVHKRRVHYTVAGAMAELSELSVGGETTRTIAIESEDPALVTVAVHELGLDGHQIVNVALGLKSLIGFGAQRYAVIDVGTNSVKFVVGEHAQDGTWRTITDRAEVTRLGEGLDQSGRLGNEPIERTTEAIAGMVDEARREGAQATTAVATAGMRIASNSADLIDVVRSRSGVEIEVISGEDEARLAYLAVTAALPRAEGTLVVFDTGGGSSQFTFGHDDHVDERFSVNVGAARFTERFGLDGAVSEEVVADALAAIGDDLSRLTGRPKANMLVGMGGAITNITAVKHRLATYDPAVVHGTVLERSEIERQIELYRTRSADERREIAGLQPKRAEVILAGALIVRTVMNLLGEESLTVSDRGLRHGVLAERFGHR